LTSRSATVPSKGARTTAFPRRVEIWAASSRDARTCALAAAILAFAISRAAFAFWSATFPSRVSTVRSGSPFLTRAQSCTWIFETIPPKSDLISAWNLGERVPTTSIPSSTSPADTRAVSTGTGGFPLPDSLPTAFPSPEHPAAKAGRTSSAAPGSILPFIPSSPFPARRARPRRSRRR